MPEYVDALGGHVGVDAGEGGGSVFWFTVPLVPRPDPVGVDVVGVLDEPAGSIASPPVDRRG